MKNLITIVLVLTALASNAGIVGNLDHSIQPQKVQPVFKNFLLGGGVNYTPISDPQISAEMENILDTIDFDLQSLASTLGVPSLTKDDFYFDSLIKVSINGKEADGEAIVAPYKFNSNQSTDNYAFAVYTDGRTLFRPVIVKTKTGKSAEYYFLNSDIKFTMTNVNGVIHCGTQNQTFRRRGSWDCGNAVAQCMADAYTNHGWASVFATVVSAFYPATVVAIGIACAGKNCGH